MESDSKLAALTCLRCEGFDGPRRAIFDITVHLPFLFRALGPGMDIADVHVHVFFLLLPLGSVER